MDEATVAQTMAQVADMRVEVARLTARFDATLSHMPIQLADHEARLRALERWRYGIPVGAAAAIVAAVSSVATVLWG